MRFRVDSVASIPAGWYGQDAGLVACRMRRAWGRLVGLAALDFRGYLTQGVALGWYDGAPLALEAFEERGDGSVGWWFRGAASRCINGRMAFNPPNPNESERRRDPGSSPGKDGGGLSSLVQAEKLMQIAFVLPCAALIGYGIGWWIDHRFGTHWGAIAGLIFGLISGMVSVIRMALSADNAPRGGR